MAAEKIRRRRELLEPAAAHLTSWAQSTGVDWRFGGSWRRESPLVGDLDVVVFTPSLLEVSPIPHFQAVRSGNTIRQGELTLGDLVVHVDVWACHPMARGAFMWFITGPADLNIAMRARAKGQGLRLSQDGLFEGDRRIASTEQEVADAIGFPWIDASERNRWRDFVRFGSTSDRRRIEIKSSDGKRTYDVVLGGTTASCTCPGFTYRQDCKHLREARDG